MQKKLISVCMYKLECSTVFGACLVEVFPMVPDVWTSFTHFFMLTNYCNTLMKCAFKIM